MNQIQIGRFIAERRKSQNLTQEDLAEKIGVSNKTVSKWECGKCMPDYSVIELLCENLHVSVSELIKGELLSQEQNAKDEAALQILENMRIQKIDSLKVKNVMLALCSIIMHMFYTIIPNDATLFIRVCSNIMHVGSIFGLVCVAIFGIIIRKLRKDAKHQSGR